MCFDSVSRVFKTISMEFNEELRKEREESPAALATKALARSGVSMKDADRTSRSDRKKIDRELRKRHE